LLWLLVYLALVVGLPCFGMSLKGRGGMGALGERMFWEKEKPTIISLDGD
jgi:hypothetical protein